MNSYEPDRWVIIEIDGLQKVLAAWVGGYLGSDEWRLSSGVVEIVEEKDFFFIKNESGSIYKCHKKMEGMTYLTSNVYRDIREKCEENGKKLTLISLKNEANDEK